MPVKDEGMIEKVDITNANIVDSIRANMNIATLTNKGLMDSLDKKRGYYWKEEVGNGKVLHVCRFNKKESVSFSAVSGSGMSATSTPTPQIISLVNHSSTGIKIGKIGNGEKWGYVVDGEFIDMYYRPSPYLGDGVFVISYSWVELTMEFVDRPANLVYF